jgi:hypothetical protein
MTSNQEHTRALAEQIFGKEFNYRRNAEGFIEVFYHNWLPRATVWVEEGFLRIQSISHDIDGSVGLVDVPLANPNLIEEARQKLKF